MFFIFSQVATCTEKPKVFIVGVEALDYYPLFSFDYQNTVTPSFARELLTNFFHAKGYAFRFLPLPIKRFNRWYIERNIDFKFPDNVRWRDDEKVKLNITYSEPIIFLTAGTYVLKNNKNISRDDVKKLGTMTGFYPTLWIDKVQNKEVELVESPATMSIIKHLIHQNVDATNIDRSVINHNLVLLNSSAEVVLNPNIINEPYAYHFSSIQYPEVIKEFNRYLVQNKKMVSDLKKKYKINKD